MATMIRYFGLMLLLTGLGACSSGPVNAPVVSRDLLGDTPTVSAAGTSGSTARPGHYIVRRGDTLYSVAWQNGLNFRQLADMNDIHPPYTIYVGQSLRVVPGSTHAAAAEPPPVAVAARRKDTGKQARPRPPEKHVSAAAPARAAPPPPPDTALPTVVSNWVWPVTGPLLRNYTPDGNGKKGIDIGGRTGQPVQAAADGKVVYAGSGLVGYGRLIIIKHNDNLLSAYGHNSELLVGEGDYVRAGQVIAKMGSSGTSSTRLYFEIRQDGKPVNPLAYLPRR
jgi:lipoprotein NlpD